MKLCTIDRNPKSKNSFVGGQNPTIPSPILPQFFYPRNALSMARSEHHSFKPCGQIVAFDSWNDASRWPLYCHGRGANKSCGGHQLPIPTPSLSTFASSLLFFPPPAPSFPLSPFLFSILPFLPSPSCTLPHRPLHSLPLPLEVDLLIADKGYGSTSPPQRSPAAKTVFGEF